MRIPVTVMLIAVLVSVFLVSVLAVPTEASAPAPEITGESAIVIDAETGAILYEQNARDRRAPASLTKIFTAYFAIEATPLQRRMQVAKDDLVGEASAGLNAGDTLSLETLLHGLMLASGNDAAMTIARNVGQSHAPSGLNGVASFTGYVNNQLENLGLRDTNLINPHGLDQSGHYSTAHDIAAMTMHALQTEPDFIRIVSSAGYAGEGTSFAQRNQMIGAYPGAIGGKTGITDDAGYCLMAIAHRDGRTLVSIVLGSTAADWYTDSMALLDHGFSVPTGTPTTYVNLNPPTTPALFTSAAASVQGLMLETAGDDMVSVRTSVASSVTTWNVLRWPLAAMSAMLIILVVLVQTRELMELQKRPMARGMRPRKQRASHRKPAPVQPPATPVVPRMDETQPFSTPRPWNPPATSWSPGIGD